MTVEPVPLPDGTKRVVEGKVTVVLPAKRLTRRTGVFYNPTMDLNRDLAILFASSHFPTWMRIRVCDPMTGSGVRAARYVLESSNVASVLAADKDPDTVEAARRTIQLNGVDAKVSVLERDANLLLTEHSENRFDLVDLDPFGSPAPFFESALRTTNDGGVVAATATDMGPLTGARAAACFRKYGVKPVRCEFEKEMALRTLASTLVSTAGRLDLGVDIVFSHATDYYARIYAKIIKGKTPANASTKKLGYLEYCANCLSREAKNSMETLRTTCPVCGSKTNVGGPIWLGPLWEHRTLQGMVQRTPTLSTSRLSDAQGILRLIGDEYSGRPFHYRTDALARSYKTKPSRVEMLLAVLRDSGFEATRTHFHPNGVRTNASVPHIAKLAKQLSEKT